VSASLDQSVERKLKGLILCLTHRVCTSSPALSPPNSSRSILQFPPGESQSDVLWGSSFRNSGGQGINTDSGIRCIVARSIPKSARS